MKRLPGLLVLAVAACHAPGAREPGGLEARVDVGALLELAEELDQVPHEVRGWIDEESWIEWGRAPGAAADAPEQLLRVEARSGRSEPLYDAEALEAALARLPQFDAGQARRAARRRRYDWLPDRSGFLLEHGGTVFAYRFEEHRAVAITSGAEAVGREISPDGRHLAFVRGGEIWLTSTAALEERPLTRGGGAEVLNGRLNWVYQEEIYGRGNYDGFWWSPDSQRIAFLQLDQSGMGEYRVEDHLPRHGAQQLYRYPKAGDPNPVARVGCTMLDGEAVWLAVEDRPADDRLIVSVDWQPDSARVLVQVTSRIQNELELWSADPVSGAARVLYEERSPAWIKRLPLTWLPDGGLLLLSDRSGWRHLYRLAEDGRITAITSGDFEVLKVASVGPEGRSVYAQTNEGNLLERHVWHVPLDGSPRRRVTQGRGTHSARVSPEAGLAVVRWSNAGDPGGLRLLELPGGEVVREIGRAPVELLETVGFREPEFLEVPNRDGFRMQAKLQRPAGFRTKDVRTKDVRARGFRAGRSFPVLIYTYGGPHAPAVRDRFGGFRDLWHSALADEGYLVWTCDNRSASGAGREAAAAMYRRAGETELADLLDGLDWLEAQGWADPARVGIWGWSYGGFMSAYALTHSDRFRMGIAGAPVTDWRNYDSIYIERYMDTPEANPEGYERSSVVAAAADLEGELLIIHGTLDENVHMANSLQLAYALQQAGKSFELMLYPKNRHGVREPRQREHLYRMMTAFILAEL